MSTIERVIGLHREALGRFEAAARNVPGARWAVPRAVGKWSPREVVEHVTLSYEQTRQMELGNFTGAAFPWYLRLLARTLFLPILLRRGSWIGGPTAGPDFLQPSATAASVAELLARLERSALALEHDLAASPDGRGPIVNHPVFGRVPLGKLLHFLALHTDHHLPQLATQAD